MLKSTACHGYCPWYVSPGFDTGALLTAGHIIPHWYGPGMQHKFKSVLASQLEIGAAPACVANGLWGPADWTFDG